jgi:hypothetical protein
MKIDNANINMFWDDYTEYKSYYIIDNPADGGRFEPHLKATSGINTLSGLLSADWYYWDQSGLSEAEVTIEKFIPTELTLSLTSSIIAENESENILFLLDTNSITDDPITRIWKTIPNYGSPLAIKGICENNVYYWFYLENSLAYKDLFNTNSLSAFIGPNTPNYQVFFISSTTYIDPYSPMVWKNSSENFDFNAQFVYFSDRLQTNLEWSR